MNGFDPESLRSVPGVSDVLREWGEVVVSGSGPLLSHIAAALAEKGVAPPDLRAEQTTLDDVFVAVTGRQIRH